MSFESLKSTRKSQLDKLLDAAKQAGATKSSGDDRFWTPTLDKAGNGYAVLRFLPQQDADALPWAQWWDHGFKGPTGKWYFEKSLSSIGQDHDPVMEMNSYLWNTGVEADKEQARNQKRRLHYVANVLVVSDSGNTDNEGKVFLFKFGKKIFDKLMEAMQPAFEDETPINPFDLWEGANFKLKIRKVEGYRNYDKSEFDSPSKVGTDAELKKLYENFFSLEEFSNPAEYKTYEELAKKLAEVFGPAGVPGQAPVATAGRTQRTPSVGKTQKAQPNHAVDDDDNLSMGDDSNDVESLDAADAGDDSMMGFFKKLAEDDD